MNRRVLPLFLLALSLPALSAPSTPPAKAKAPAATTPFSLEWEAIPASFRPDDFATVYGANSKAKPKGEFETEAQYRARLTVDTSRLYSFKVTLSGFNAFKYDAEEQTYPMPFPFDAEQLVKAKGETGPEQAYAVLVTLSETEKAEAPDTVASNAFGAKAVIKHRAAYVNGAAIYVQNPDSAMNPHISAYWGNLQEYAKAQGIKVPVEEAKTLKGDLEMLVVIQLSGGFKGQATFNGYDYSEATFQNPTERTRYYKLLSGEKATLVVYSKRTGKVLKKWTLEPAKLTPESQ